MAWCWHRMRGREEEIQTSVLLVLLILPREGSYSRAVATGEGVLSPVCVCVCVCVTAVAMGEGSAFREPV